MSQITSSHAYGIVLIAVIIGAAVGVSYYQLYFIPEYNAKPHFGNPRITNPGQTTTINIVTCSVYQDQTQNFLPKKQTVQLGIDNSATWKNNDDAVH